MKRLLIALCAALSATPATGSAGAADPSTMALVRAAGFDVAMLDALAYSNGRVLFEKEQYDRLSQCIAQHGPGLLTAVLADWIAQSLTPAEVRIALDFYASPLGKRFFDGSLLAAHQAHQIDLGKPLPTFSKEEQLAMRAFVESPVARKLGGVVSDQGVLVVIKQTILEACAGR